jgi:hypothetical protein
MPILAFNLFKTNGTHILKVKVKAKLKVRLSLSTSQGHTWGAEAELHSF